MTGLLSASISCVCSFCDVHFSQSIHAEFMRRGDGRMGADNRAWCLRTTTVLSCYRKWVRIPVYVEEEQFHLNRPRSIHKYSNMAPRLSDQNCKLNFLSCFCLLIIPRRGLDTKKTPPNIDVCPESLGANIKNYFRRSQKLARGSEYRVHVLAVA